MNSMTRHDYIMVNLAEHYKEATELGHEVVGVWLQGSQNYELDCYTDEYRSDIDTKCIILPSFDDIVSGKQPYSHTHVRANNEHIDIKDVRTMVDMFKKQNNAYIELLFTKYYIINPKYEKLINELISHAEAIAHLNVNQALRCLAGTSLNKLKSLEHPYPNVLDKLDKFGYDPKQLHHIIRINELTRKYISGLPYKQCLIPDDKVELLKIKIGKYPLEIARKLAKDYDESTKSMIDSAMLEKDLVDRTEVDFLDQLKKNLIAMHLKEELQLL